ncbi:MAG: ABC transporter substrate-binding protein [Desulfobacteraceae bacterium]|nr:ABC transporter substrate-binding protein [Desulfobacteraceae bacterium]
MKIRYHRPAPVFICLLISALLHIGFSPQSKADSRREITDMAGRRITIDSDVNRIVTSFKPATLCILSLGLQDKLVGVDTSSLRDKLNLSVFPGIADLPGVGSKAMGLNYESIMSLSPDLIILYAQKDGKELAKQFEKINIPAIIILPENFDGIKTSLKIIAMAVGEPERSLNVEKAMDYVMGLVEKRVAAIPQNRKKTAYFASPRGLYSTATGNMLQDEMFTKAGLINVAHDLEGYFQDISPEQFVKWNPDMVILSQHSKSKIIRKLNNPAIKNVEAIKTKTVYKSPSTLSPWDFPSPLSALGTLWLANRAYPEFFDTLDLLKETDRFHVKIFGKSLKQMNGSLNDQIYEKP